jgi:hypothetical protein
MPTNVFFSPSVQSEQFLYEDLIIEGLRIYGQDVLYIPREEVSSDEILNEEYSRFRDAYAIEMYIANTEGFEGEGTLLSKFGLEIRDQATFIVARRRFQQLVEVDVNSLEDERPREGDLVYLPLANSLFEIKFVEHEKPFYRLSDLPIFELRCELYESGSEQLDTGFSNVDQFERTHASRTVLSIGGGSTGLEPGTEVFQFVQEESSDQELIVVHGEVADFVTTQEADSGQESTADLSLVGVSSTDGELRSFSPSLGNIFLIDDEVDTGWEVLKEYNLADTADKYISNDEFADNTQYEIDADQILDFSQENPFGDPRLNN